MTKLHPEFDEFKIKGYIKSPRKNWVFRNYCTRNNLSYKIFRADSALDILGIKHDFYYDPNRKEEFINYLEQIFHSKNSRSEPKYRFSWLLRKNNLR